MKAWVDVTIGREGTEALDCLHEKILYLPLSDEQRKLLGWGHVEKAQLRVIIPNDQVKKI